MKRKTFIAGCALTSVAAGTLAVALLLASPAAADHHNNNGRGGYDEYPWDTDNLRYGGFTARSFNVPFHEYGGYSETACQSGVADAFFQAGGTVGAVNDFPYLDWVASDGSGSWVEKESGVRNDGCDEFVAQQDKMVSQIASNGGYYLDLSGNLRNLGSVPSRFSGRSFSYVNWDSKGDDFGINSGTGEVADGSRYKNRVDGWSTTTGYYRAILPSGTTWNVPPDTQNGRFGTNWHGTTRRQGSSILTRVARPVISGGYLPMDNGLCPAGFHPRGEDSVGRIGSHTGRTLTGLSHAVGKTADRYWCRSDLRFERRFHPENHSGVAKHPQAAAREFTAYGRLNCYYTAFPITSHASGTEGIRPASSGGMVCSYLFPLPECDPDPDNGSNSDWRDYRAAELRDMSEGSAFTHVEGASCTTATTTSTTTTTTTTTATAVPGSPPPTTLPPLPSFADDACVTVTLKINEDRTKNSNAEPGIQVPHRTLTTLIAPAYDLDVTSPHPNTASPPRDTNDKSGCAYGPESRTDHGTADSAARENRDADDGTTSASVALPKSSAAANSQHPPHNQGFASAGTDYTGAVQNMAHRYASKVAENTCSASRKFAELVLEILKGRRLVFLEYVASYRGKIVAAIDAYTSYRSVVLIENSNAALNLSLESLRQNTLERQRQKYANDRKAYLEALREALDDAKGVYETATNNLVLAQVAENGCVNGYNGEIARLRKIVSDAEAAFTNPLSPPARRQVTLSDNTYDATGSTSSWRTEGTAGFERLYNQLSLVSYTNLVPMYNTPSASPPSDGRPRDGALNWAEGTWSAPARSYQCTRPSYASLSNNIASCVRSMWVQNFASESCSHNTQVEGFNPWGPETLFNPFLGIPQRVCVARAIVGNDFRTGSVVYSCPDATWTLNDLNGTCGKWMAVTTAETPRYRDYYTRTDTYSNMVSGTVTGRLTGTAGRTATFSVTYTGSRECRYATGTYGALASRSSPDCDTGRAIRHNPRTGTSLADARSTVIGSPHSVNSLPANSVTDVTTNPPAFPSVTESALLGRLHPSHASRNDLTAASAAARNTAATNLGTLTRTVGSVVSPSASASAINSRTGGSDGYASGFVPSANTAQRTAIANATTSYLNEYAKAYGTAYSAALSDMGSTATTTTWNNFVWRYVPYTLAWVGYLEDNTAGTGCDLIAVGLDGSVSVDATRLDYEGVPLSDPTAESRYGVGSVFGTRTLAQRTCKIFRERAPELILEYQPPARSGTDASKGSAFWHVDYQPTPGAERFKLYREAEVFAVKVSLKDSVPVLCYQPGEALVAHVGAKGIDAVNKAVFRGASGGNEKHCYQRPSVSQPAFALFDDTAHSAMESVSVVWQQPTPQIVSKLGSTDDLKMMANTVNLVASSVAYVDAARTSSFYGTYYTFPTGSSVESPSGWDITGHPTLTLASTFAQHVVQAKDTATRITPTSQALVFKFVDCVFGIEDVAFVDNIASPYALLSDENGVVPSGWKRTYDSDPHSSPTWYYPPFSTYEGALRLDGRRYRNGDPITYQRNPQGGFAHPSYELESTASDGIGWGIVYEDKINKQQPVWAIYAPPVPGDNTQLAIYQHQETRILTATTKPEHLKHLAETLHPLLWQGNSSSRQRKPRQPNPLKEIKP